MKIAVVGATGMVGQVMLQVLAERNFPITELIPVASEKSVGKKVLFKGKEYPVVSMQTAVGKVHILPYFRQEEVPRWSGLQSLQRWELS